MADAAQRQHEGEPYPRTGRTWATRRHLRYGCQAQDRGGTPPRCASPRAGAKGVVAVVGRAQFRARAVTRRLLPVLKESTALSRRLQSLAATRTAVKLLAALLRLSRIARRAVEPGLAFRASHG